MPTFSTGQLALGEWWPGDGQDDDDDRNSARTLPRPSSPRQSQLSEPPEHPNRVDRRKLTSMSSSSSSALGGALPSQFGMDPLVQVLLLDSEVLLQSFPRLIGYNIVHGTARMLPALVIYGGTLGLLMCAVCRYRWGVLLSLTLYTVYMFIQSAALLVFSLAGIIKVWNASNTRWYTEYCRFREGAERPCEARPLSLEWKDSSDLDWHDVLHIVMLPSYKTPVQVLEETLQALEKFDLATTCMGVVLAFEQHEEGIVEKARLLKAKFEGRFRFVLVSFHPPNLPNHMPGKSSNECFAFQTLCSELERNHGIHRHDPRVVITVMDDDSEFHENYFEALTYHFVTTPSTRRYITTWQPPICHFKNYLRQPLLVRVSSLFATLSELAALSNPMDCHVNYSSYSLSLALASAVGGWDPDYLAEDWHMYAKCSLMTAGRVRCEPIFLPLLNYTPEEDTYLGTCHSRWEQAKRHALGVSELVYVIQGLYLGLLETRGSLRRLIYFWRICPILGKFAQVHFMNGMSAVLNVLAQFVIHFYMWRSWCYVSEMSQDRTCGLLMQSATQEGIAQEQIVLNSWMVHWQLRLSVSMAFCTLISGGFGAIYFHLVRDRVEGDLAAHPFYRYVILHWINVEVSVTAVGWLSSVIYGAAPLWIAVSRIICEAKFTHVVAGMVGRSLKFEE
mmetsp:Transcript_105776/g.297962  ORF Transcript_105776/g.297962 Transcript_105776/m.297962 type:complete len:675 (+) Transcript_105776:62-2086(+)